MNYFFKIIKNMRADLGLLEIQSMISTNLTAVMASCKEAINSMKKHDIKDGHIININRYADSHYAKYTKKKMDRFVCWLGVCQTTIGSRRIRYLRFATPSSEDASLLCLIMKSDFNKNELNKLNCNICPDHNG